MNSNKKIKLTLSNQYKDGGTLVYVDDNNKEYFVDHRSQSTTKGKLFSNYPDEPDAFILDINNYELIDVDIYSNLPEDEDYE